MSRSVSLLAVTVLALTAAAVPPSTASSGTPPTHRPASVRGDFDGDGRIDVAVGAPGRDAVRVTYTRATPGGSHTVWLTPNAASYSYRPQFGHALAIGDFNGDGRSDLAVGAPSYTTPPITDGVTETRGAVFLYLGSAHGLRDQPLAITGPYNGDEPYNLGDSLAAADVNADGRDDLATSLLGSDNGNIRVYHGSPAGLATSYQALDDYEPTSLAFGDVNGDHHPELVVASTVDLANSTDIFYGDVMVFHGSATGLRPHHPQKIRGNQVGVTRMFGSSVATGDVNGDGIADVVAGAAYDRYVGTRRSGGTIVLLTGGPHGLKASRHQTINERAVYGHWHDGDGFGASLVLAKVDGDRFADLVVGAPTARVGAVRNAGTLYVLKGRRTGLSTAGVRRVTQASHGVPGSVARGAQFGLGVWAARLDADRFADVIAGVPYPRSTTHGGGFIRFVGSGTGLQVGSAHGTFSHTGGDQLGLSIR